ncbi:hypothetical protein E2C01_057846 [Portunus trituberculatus]|uniref:Uncharacterized protein n=1 Tax=Portunus trituberculatus TaxID=210409 RepID=A0A5B7H138_PORTR|nr:hypothetical protein [Portunus trituberculatus]
MRVGKKMLERCRRRIVTLNWKEKKMTSKNTTNTTTITTTTTSTITNTTNNKKQSQPQRTSIPQPETRNTPAAKFSSLVCRCLQGGQLGVHGRRNHTPTTS